MVGRMIVHVSVCLCLHARVSVWTHFRKEMCSIACDGLHCSKQSGRLHLPLNVYRHFQVPVERWYRHQPDRVMESGLRELLAMVPL